MSINALIGLGANLGDREGNLTCAWELLGQVPGVRTLRLSRFYETEAMTLSPGLVQPKYLNAVGLLATELDLCELFDVLTAIERQLGRVRTERWGPRTIDLDLLLFGDREWHTESLTVPHPRMTERRFVLEPAAEIVPEMRHPTVGKTIAQLLNERRL
ncbi:MAG: 2-amino-4-hydroxy-6-hydroxymethyldihydropteridine diphosphokinase [Planctomycetaceae bacterium]|nr:2-amino-4-hydroxy-6-hydroxymethyldihydropteridine diphosphokinase [Planctomycetaceae bacterium]